MRYFIIIAITWLAVGTLSAQKYYVKVDSASIIQFVSGKTYKMADDEGNIKVLKLEKIEGDSFYFESESYHFSEITALKNPKRKEFLDVVSYPITIGSCIGMSAFPIIYARGYFASDADGMLNSLAIFIGQTIIFAASRNYIAKNEKWLDLSKLKQLEVRKKK